MAVSGDHEEDEQNEDKIAGDDGGDAHTGGAPLPLTLQQKRLRLYPTHLSLCFLPQPNQPNKIKQHNANHEIDTYIFIAYLDAGQPIDQSINW